MKKTLLLIITLVLVLLLAIPSTIGRQAEARYQDFLTQMQRNGLRIVRHDYQRGWLQATAKTEFELIQPPASYADSDLKPLRFVLDNRINHGPYSPQQGLVWASFAVDTKVHSEDGSLFPSDYPGQIYTRIKWDGTGATLIDLPKYERPFQAGQAAIRFDGAQGQILYGIGLDRIKADITAPFLRFSNHEKPLLEFAGVSFKSDYRRAEDGLMVGTARFDLTQLHLHTPDAAEQLQLQGLTMDFENTASDGMANGLFSYRLTSAIMNGDSYGPMRLDIRASNLATPALVRLEQALEEIAAQQLSDEQQAMAVFGTLLGSGPELLAGNPRLAIEQLHITTPEGLIEGHFEVQPLGLQWSEISNIPVILEKLSANAGLQMPEKYFHALFEQQARQSILSQFEQQRLLGAPADEPDPAELDAWASAAASQQIEGLLAQEILVREHTQLGTSLSLKNGLLSINGKAVPIPLLTDTPSQTDPRL